MKGDRVVSSHHLSQATRAALKSIADWIAVNEGAFAFGLFASEVDATSVFGTGSAGTITPPGPTPPESEWSGVTTDGQTLTMMLNLSTGDVTVSWGSSSVSSVVHLIDTSTVDGQRWFFHLLTASSTPNFQALSITQM
jgi:hypothetical protein